MKGGARAKRAQFFFCANYSIDSLVERLETKAVTCTQSSSCSQAYVDFKCVRLVVTSILEPLQFSSYSDKKYN